MSTQKTGVNRRLVLQRAAIAASALAMPLRAQNRKQPQSLGRIVVAQPVDFSQAQQDVSKDFLIGSQAAWQDINARGGLKGRPVQHETLETDGTAAGLLTAVDTIKNNPACVVLSGTAGDRLANQLLTTLRSENLLIAHAAPWLQNSGAQIDGQTFPIFAARQEQIAHALKTLSVMGLKELGAVYASAAEKIASQGELERIAASMQLKLVSFEGVGELRLLGQKMNAATPAVLLFLGGTPELADFTQGLEKQMRQRYIVALADVNLQTLMEMGAARNTAVIATQPVPMVNTSLPIVRNYRATLARLFDEPPAPLSLAGFIAARYTYEVLDDIEGPPTRQNVLAAFQRRASHDLGGFRVHFDNQGRAGHYVTQSMMTIAGKLVG